jgi:hypothetical protein
MGEEFVLGFVKVEASTIHHRIGMGSHLEMMFLWRRDRTIQSCGSLVKVGSVAEAVLELPSQDASKESLNAFLEVLLLLSRDVLMELLSVLMRSLS